ncbi:hypothetical protein G9272_07265 [Streptomyces asoensis]|uniref:Uncharacterized protein n=1 Tax=Streptomyces asoensis TaxID=249586 RepID=A0A6M4WHF4_9ACTN|nr:hypothetical protein [Streptomyces asoensis]QJT00107.1 hypothetical protein G9272_07265 [Streptomyces asoensis]
MSQEIAPFLLMRKGGEGAVVTQEDLRSIWFDLLPDDYSSEIGCAAFLEGVAHAVAHDAPDTELEIRPGGWEVDLSQGAARTAVAMAFVAGLLVLLGAPQVAPAVVTTVVPLLFDVRRVRLSESQGCVLAELVRHPDVVEGRLTPEQMHTLLPAAVRADFSLLDLKDFLGVCRRAGVADFSEDGTAAVRPEAKARFRVTIL